MIRISSPFRTLSVGAFLVALGIANELLLVAAISPDGVVEDMFLRATLWAFDFTAIVAGSLLFSYGAAAIEFLDRHIRWFAIGGFVLLTGLWVGTVGRMYAESGLFRWIANDYGIYHAQASVLRSGDLQGIYSLEALQHEYQKLYDAYESLATEAATATQVPYPPLFAWLFQPFTLLEPHVGFVLWTALNAAAGLWLVWRAAKFFPSQLRYLVATCLVTSYAFVYSLLTGQPMLLLACSVAAFYLCLRARRDLWAGLCLSLLFFKPHYGALLGAVLIWKRRWTAVAGAGVGVLAIVVGSVMVAGIPVLLSYPDALAEMATFRGDSFTHMINWRALILWLRPGIESDAGMALEIALAAATVLLTAFAWRGPWKPHERSFPVLISLTIVATLLASHHSLQYGAVLLAVPLASALADGGSCRFTIGVVLTACLLPAISFTLAFSLDAAQASRLLAVSLVICFASLFADVNRTRGLSMVPDFVRRLWS